MGVGKTIGLAVVLWIG